MNTSETGWKPARQGVRPLNDNGVKRAWKDHREIAKKLNEFFALVFTVDDAGEKTFMEPPLFLAVNLKNWVRQR